MVEPIINITMKHRKLIYLIFAALSLPFVGCEKEYEDESKITYFPEFVMEGESEIIQILGEAYTDGSVTATEAGNPLDVTIIVRGEMTGYSGTTVNVDEVDKYTITYSATNVDGFDGSVSRTVYVAPPTGDMVTSIEGLYLGNVQRAPAFAVLAQYSDLQYIYIWKTGANKYTLSCALGGYYSIGRIYGYDYAFQGAEITANDIPTNSFSITQATAPGFGNVADISEFIVDPINKRITFTGTADFANGAFHVQLEQIQL
jgi:hypothetical protein